MEFGQLEAKKLQNPAVMLVRYFGSDLKDCCSNCKQMQCNYMG